MATSIGPEDSALILKFGGGINSRASENDINLRECAEGVNFELDPQNKEFRNRKPFDLIATVPNTSEIRGFANLYKADGTSSVLVQAGDTVYEWDGATTFTSRGTVSATAQLRGRLDHNWLLDDKVIITDLNHQEDVMEWDGTTLQDVTFTNEDGSTAFGNFKAKYCVISNERVIFANINDNGTTTEHLIVGCQRGNFTVITVNQRPSSSLSEEDPFFLIQPDYRPCNGLVEAFGVLATSSLNGSIFKLTGDSAKDFAFNPLHPRSGALGTESVTYVGNDVFYGREGRIESLASTDKFGDVEVDDVSLPISGDISDFNEWTIVYNQKLQRIYCFPCNNSQVWVYHKSLADFAKLSGGESLSPWVKWTTNHSMALNPTATMNMIDPVDGLEYVFMGDANGNFYRLEGSGLSGDGGTNDIKTERKSGLISVSPGAEAFDIEGWISYRKGDAATVTIQIEYSGSQVFNKSVTLSLPTITNRPVYAGGIYYSNGESYSTAFSGRITRQKFPLHGKSQEFQIKVTVEGTTNFQINEVGVRLQATS